MVTRHIGRLFWDADRASPWVEFDSKRDFEIWRANIRRALPGTQTEYEIVGAIHNPASLLTHAKDTGRNQRKNEHRKEAKEMAVIAGESKRARLERLAERKQADIDRLEAQIAALEALPDEPQVDDGEPNVIWWTKTFQNGSREYTYAAVKAGDGLWYTTGPNVPKGYSWDALIEWITDGEAFEIWHATGYDSLD